MMQLTQTTQTGGILHFLIPSQLCICWLAFGHTQALIHVCNRGIAQTSFTGLPEELRRACTQQL